MDNFVVVGVIYRASHEAVDELMRAAFGDIQARSRLFGYDILIEREGLRLFCATTDNDGREWSVNADFKGTSRDLTDLLTGLTQKLVDAGYNYSFGYNQVDENGDELGEEISLYHPDFDRLYALHRATP